MPTNKLWLEHTEKAAWESVQALREKLAEAEKRMQRLAPPVNGWQALLDELDAARGELSLDGASYSEVVAELLLRSRGDAERARAVEQELAELRSVALRGSLLPVPAPSASRRAFDEDDVLERAPDTFTEFTRKVRLRERTLAQEGQATGLDELLSRVEAKVEEMGELEDASLHEASVDLAALALLLSTESKKGID